MATPPTPPENRDWHDLFLEKLRVSGNVSLAAKIAGVPRSSVYMARLSYPEFSKAWDDALEEASDGLEAEAYRRAVEGVDYPVFQGGQQCGVMRRYSDQLLMLLLKAHKPKKYREHHKVEVDPGATGNVILEHFKDALLRAYGEDGEDEEDGEDIQ